MKTTEAVKGKWGFIFDYYQLPPITGKRHYRGEAPCCGRRGKFRIDDKDGNGTFICACGEAGNGWKLLTIATGKDFATLAKEINELLGITYEHQAVEKPKQYTDELTKYRDATPVHDTGVQEYLHSRGINCLPQRAIKCSDGNMFAIASDGNGNPVFSHTTYLENGKKADVDVGKKMISIMPEQQREMAESVAIRMFDVAQVLGIAEGIETSLSVKQIYKVNTWSVINSTYMKKFTCPKGVNVLRIYADNDANGTGLAAAFECGRRNILSQKNDVTEVIIFWPSLRGDFNDMLTQGCEVYQWKLERK